MKAILMSIKPKWCEMIFSGKKTIEVRKTAPKETPFKVYVYETQGATETPWVDEDGHLIWKGRGQVIGEFVCGRVKEYRFSNYKARYNINDVDLMTTCLNHPDFIQYGKGKPLYGWHISDLKIYDKPRELSDFKTPDKPYHEIIERDGSLMFMDGYESGEPLKRAPQSWQFVEEI